MIEITCECSMKKHRAPLEEYEISSGAIKKIPEMLKDYKRIYMVADANTYKAAGAAVEEILKTNGMHFKTFVFNELPVLPSADSIGKLILNFQPLDAKPKSFAFGFKILRLCPGLFIQDLKASA